MTLRLIEKIAEKRAELNAKAVASKSADQVLLHILATEMERLSAAGFSVSTTADAVVASNSKCEIRCFVEAGTIKVDGRAFSGGSPFAMKRVIDPEDAIDIIADHIARHG